MKTYLQAMEGKMAAKTVNLDALIPRQDFLGEDGPEHGKSGKESVSKTDLQARESFYLSLAKPDFQRETAAWSPQKIVEFIRAFLTNDLIPAVICWQSPSRLSFVIDGAHRLSAIIAWLNDDYGDGEISTKFYNNQIPPEQREIADKTKRLIKKELGSFRDIQAEIENPGSNPTLSVYAKALAHSNIKLQWIDSPEVKKAENAFFTINQSAVKIEPVELKILNTRFEPNAIAARAIVRNATGHKYWGKFSGPGIIEIEKNAQNIYSLLFKPPLQSPVRTIELPIAGLGYGSQSLPLIYDFVNLANELPVEDPSKFKKLTTDHAEPNEATTIKIVGKSLKLAQRITGTHPSSFGLHPAVYFYSSNGRHQPTAVLAMFSLLKDMEKDNSYNKFTDTRAAFEDFLLDHKDFINQLTRKYGSMAKGYRPLKEFYKFIIKCISDGVNETEDIEHKLIDSDGFSFLQITRAIQTTRSRDFSGKAKQLAFLQEALSATVTCNICGARKDNKSITADHAIDQKFHGAATTDNLQFVHPYCNSTYKDYKARL